MTECHLEYLRQLDRTPRQIGLWETVTNDSVWPVLVEDVKPDPRYL